MILTDSRPRNPSTRRISSVTAALASARSRLAVCSADAFAARVPATRDASTIRLAPKPAFRSKAKRVIHLFMAGAPSQLDLFDFKPELVKLEGKPLPPSMIGGQRYAFIRRMRPCSARGSSSPSTASAASNSRR